MGTISVAATVTSSLVALFGLMWMVLFGQQRNLVDMMRSQRGKRAKVASAGTITTGTTPETPLPSSRKTSRKGQQAPSRLLLDDEDKSAELREPDRELYRKWLVITGRLVFQCWSDGADFLPDEDATLTGATGCLMRICLIFPVILLLPGLFLTLISLPYGIRSDGFMAGTFFLGGFLATFVTEFFIVGMISLIGLVHALMPDEVFE